MHEHMACVMINEDRSHANTMNSKLFSGWGIRILICLVIIVVLSAPAQATDKATRAKSDEKTEASKLEGRWIRTDGGYSLELSNIGADGALTAAYFNPRPIKVSKAAWNIKDGRTILFVELRDVNYPGSTYTLQYDPASDRLQGTYFQAVEKLTYAIEFVRRK